MAPLNIAERSELAKFYNYCPLGMAAECEPCFKKHVRASLRCRLLLIAWVSGNLQTWSKFDQIVPSQQDYDCLGCTKASLYHAPNKRRCFASELDCLTPFNGMEIYRAQKRDHCRPRLFVASIHNKYPTLVSLSAGLNQALLLYASYFCLEVWIYPDPNVIESSIDNLENLLDT